MFQLEKSNEILQKKLQEAHKWREQVSVYLSAADLNVFRLFFLLILQVHLFIFALC